VILVDTSIWVDHLRARDDALGHFLEAGQVLVHPFVIGELALGHLKTRHVVLAALKNLPHARLATDGEVLHFIDRRRLAGLGIGYIDAHLLAAVHLTPGASLWTRDKRLHTTASRLGVAMT
jgi:predicted nucleic acid-binding protein